jgi:hypothetical protein
LWIILAPVLRLLQTDSKGRMLTFTFTIDYSTEAERLAHEARHRPGLLQDHSLLATVNSSIVAAICAIFPKTTGVTAREWHLASY